MWKDAQEDNKELVSSDLMKMGELLNDAGLCHNISPLTTASNSCKHDSDGNFWIYSMEKLEFNRAFLYAPSGTIPVGVKNLGIELSIIAKGRFFDSRMIQNPLLEYHEELPYCFDLEISGESEDGFQLFSSWHFDKSLRSDTPKFIHPEYHWTFGGDKMKEKTQEVGGTVILPSPRISHPPFDAILAIDYIIKHYMERDECEALLEDSIYREIVMRSQKRLWRPYALSFAAHWISLEGVSLCQEFQPELIFPELFK